MSSFSTVPRKGPVSLKGVERVTTPAMRVGRALISGEEVVSGGGRRFRGDGHDDNDDPF